MTRILSFTIGLSLILLGGLLLAINLFTQSLGLAVPGLGRLWPLVLFALSLMFLLPPVLAPRLNSLGALFIPGLPILAVGSVALFANFQDARHIWGMLWPQIIIALALGLSLAAIYLKV